MPNISYISLGEGETILFLHGWGQNKEMMEPLIDELKHKYRCVILDLPGFGKSSFNNTKTIDSYLEDIRLFLVQKNILPKYIVGHSFGGKLATLYYLKYKDLLGLVIIASPLLKPKRTLKYYYKIYAHKIKKKLKIKNNGGSTDYKNCPSQIRPLFINVVNTHFDKKINNITIPTLLIWGDKDEQVPLNKAKKINKKMVNSELCIEKGGHFAYLDNIQFTRLIIQQFLRRNNGD